MEGFQKTGHDGLAAPCDSKQWRAQGFGGGAEGSMVQGHVGHMHI